MLKWIIVAAGLALTCIGASAAELGDDGLHKEDWFSLTFRDVAEDIRAADAEGKRLAIVFEQRGCIYCKKMHEELLSDPEIRDYIKANFNVVQYNLFGDEEVTDLDGEKLTEKSAARRWRIVFTPTILFMPDKVPDGGDGRRCGGGDDAGRVRQEDLPAHVRVGAREGLPHRRALPEVPRPQARRERRQGRLTAGTRVRPCRRQPPRSEQVQHIQKKQFLHSSHERG